jgi:hypothetical protein
MPAKPYRMKKNILTLIAIISIFSACTKEKGAPGGSGDYQPLTANSTWSYRNESLIEEGMPTEVDTTINTMTATTKVFDGKTFHLLHSVTAGINEDSYLGYNNHIYTARNLEEDGIVIYDYLDETKAAGFSEIMPFSGLDKDAQIKTSVVEKDINKTILGKAYSNVIHTRLETQIKETDEFKTVSTIDFYIAKNIGVIATYTDFDGTQISKTEMISADIK